MPIFDSTGCFSSIQGSEFLLSFIVKNLHLNFSDLKNWIFLNKILSPTKRTLLYFLCKLQVTFLSIKVTHKDRVFFVGGNQ